MDSEDRTVILQVLDTAWQEMYKSLVRVYLRGARAVIIVYSIIDKESFNSLSFWFKFLNDTLSEKIRTFLVANEIDLLPPSLTNFENTNTHNQQYKYKQAVDDNTTK